MIAAPTTPVTFPQLLRASAGLALAIALSFSPRGVVAQDVVLSEFVASNGGGFWDEDGDNSDWIELHNSGSTAVDLDGWSLTDDGGDPAKWPLPSLVLSPDAYLVVFASGKDRRTVGNTWDTVVRANDLWRYRMGDTPPTSWQQPSYDDIAWQSGAGPLGYGENGIQTTVPNGTQGLYIRRTFTVEDPSQVLRALLHISFDDGFVAYLNGTEIARSNCCTSPTAGEPGPLEVFNLDDVASLLQPGDNLLAIELRNANQTSSDLLIIPYLTLEFATAPSALRGVVNEVRPIPESHLHTNFSLAQEGEYLALVAPGGTPVAELDPYPPQYATASYGLSGGAYGYFNTPTPGAANSGNVQDVLEPPTLSMEHGFFEEPFKLVMIPETPGSSIRYTLDGSQPTATNGLEYVEPLLIDRTTVVRAIATAPNAINSASVTQTYLFPEDIIRQSSNGAPPPGWPARWGSNATDYGMDPQVVNSREDEVIASLLSLPSFSIVTDLEHLFDEETGIYSNALGYGREWERPTSAELIFPDGTRGFQVNAGLRIRGGYSRNDPNPKHAFRLYFRNDYGPGKLVYPLFGTEGVDEFDTIDLRTSQNYSWAYNGDGRNTMVREVWSRDTQREMGEPYTRSRYYHLYVNGQYWGVFQTQERAEASYAESYFGGDKEEYDVIKSAGLADGYQIEATDGDFAAWRSLWEGTNALARMTSESERTEAYMRLQGLNPDGTRNPAYEVLLDVDNLINYMLVIFYTGNFDSPISGFIGNERTNNFFSMRRRGGESGFVHFAHDNEHTLLPEDNRYTNRTGPYPAGTQFEFSNPQWLHQQLMASAEYRLRFADLAHRHLFNGGVLTTPRVLSRFETRAAQVGPAMLAESARWGDSKRGSPLGPTDWQNEINRLRNNIFPPRNAQIVSQLRTTTRYIDGMPSRGTTSAPLYPSIVAPTFSANGGEVAANYALEMTVPTGQIFYTTDGSDPRLIGGAVAPTADEYTGSITLQNPVTVSARTRTATGWSPLMQAHFRPGSVEASENRLVIAEINYHPANTTPEEEANGYVDREDFEFVELLNNTSQPLDLSGVRFVDGLEFAFGELVVDPGARVLLASNPAALEFRYGSGVPVVGTYSGRLSNAGEQLTIAGPDGGVLASVDFGDDRPWPTRADRAGSSLELISPDAPVDDASNWRASFDYLGSPGSAGSAAPPGIVINEVLTNSVNPVVDAIELHNPTAADVDISGWYLSDSFDFRKYRIPDGTRVPAGGYVTFDEADFNPPDDSTAFALNGDRGESIWLLEAQGGEIRRFVDEAHIPATREGEALGRWPNGSGEFFSMTAASFGAANPGPRIGPVVIREIMYEPIGNNENLEYIEVFNAGSTAEDLTNWTIDDAVSFTFPAGVTLGPDESVVVVGFDPANQGKSRALRQAYWYLGGSRLAGPWTGRLDNAGEPIVLYRAIPASDPQNPMPQVLEDRVTYSSAAPWPTDAAGEGAALRRVDPFAFSNDAANWSAERRAVKSEQGDEMPARTFALAPPYPNPARETATIVLSIPTAQRVQVQVYDVLGRRVAQLHDGMLEGGREHRLEFRTGRLSSGLYLIRAAGAGVEDTASITVVR